MLWPSERALFSVRFLVLLESVLSELEHHSVGFVAVVLLFESGVNKLQLLIQSLKPQQSCACTLQCFPHMYTYVIV